MLEVRAARGYSDWMGIVAVVAGQDDVDRHVLDEDARGDQHPDLRVVSDGQIEVS